MGRTALIVLAVALLVGSAAAFTRSERLKLAASPLGKPKFERHLSPTCDCRHATASLSFLLRRPERLDVSVVDSDGEHVATLADGEEFDAGTVSFEWGGKDDDGQAASDGLYRLRVRLERDRRNILIPKTIAVDTGPPQLRLLEAVTRDQGVLVRYETSEGARVRVLSDGEQVASGERSSAGVGRITWTPAGAPPAGRLKLVAVDRSGNRSEPVQFSVASP
jgi:flagellar hook capping protein FlgD